MTPAKAEPRCKIRLALQFNRTARAAALALALVPASAMAQDGPRLDCAAKAADKALRTDMVHMMTSEVAAEAQAPALRQFSQIVEDCVTRHAIDRAHAKVYFEYNMARVARETLGADLAAAGLPGTLVDTTFDYGPGRSNPIFNGDELTEEGVQAMLEALGAAGVDLAKVDQAAWTKLGAYLVATSVYWNRRQQLPY